MGGAKVPPFFVMGDVMQKYATQDTFLKFDEVSNSYVESPLLFSPEEALGEVAAVGHTVYVSSSGTMPGGGGHTEMCTICHEEFRVGDMVEFRGKFYCKERLHNKVISGILIDENSRKVVPVDAGRSVQIVIDEGIV